MDTRLRAALDRFGKAMTQADDGLGHLTCLEFQPIAELLVVAGLPDRARDAICGHAKGDDDVDDHHGDLYDALTGRRSTWRLADGLLDRYMAEIDVAPTDDGGDERGLRRALASVRHAVASGSIDSEIIALRTALDLALARWPGLG